MTSRLVYAYSKEKTREWPVPDPTPIYTPVLSAGGESGITITERGSGVTQTRTFADGVTITQTGVAPVGVRTDSAIVAVDGSWVLPVAGATGTTPRNTPVYITAGRTLTLTATGNTFYGVVDSYPGKATAAATVVKIGVSR